MVHMDSEGNVLNAEGEIEKQIGSRYKMLGAFVGVAMLAVIGGIVILSPGHSGATSLDSAFPATMMTLSYNGVNTNYGVYLADTENLAERGYMNQSSIGDCKGISPCMGMLFYFQNTTSLCFWMKNTEIPLRQYWLDNNMTVIYAYNAVPESTHGQCYVGSGVLETSMNQSIPIGARIQLQG
ncbi:MAG TPA: DUF192 domain-containing protein [Candidatus Acidoferrales bacterium]|nr:DUF192 domain-containing protein [Candidatus Acidoferrales bacterium]